MSKMTKLVGPPRDGGTFDKRRASVLAVAMSPSVSTRSIVPVGKNGNTSVKELTKRRGRA